jgi:acyl dehydratase
MSITNHIDLHWILKERGESMTDVKGKYFDELKDGDEFVTASWTVTEGHITNFAGLSGDFNPLHTDEEFGKKGTPFGGRIAHGMLIASMATGQANQLGIFEGTSLAVLGIDLKFTAPVRPGDTVRTRLKVAELKESSKGGRGVATFDVTVLNQKDEAVLQSKWAVMLKCKGK